MKKRTISLMLAVALVMACLTGCGGSSAGESSNTPAGNNAPAAQQRVWKLSHMRAEGTDNDNLAHEFADNVMGQIDGLQIDIYANNQLGDYTVVQEAVGLGEVEMALASMSNGVDPTLSVQIAPYLVTNWDEAQKFYNSTDGMMFEYIRDRLVEQNIKLLAVIPKYFGAIMTTKEAQNIDDPTSNKGVKIRVPQMNSFESFASSIGFQTTPLPASDGFTALQTHVVDGFCGGGNESYWNDYREVVKFMYCLKTHMENHWLYMSMDTWNSLNADEQAIITQAAKDLENSAFDLAMSNEEKFNNLFEENGVPVYVPSDEVVETYKEYVRTNVWPQIASEYGEVWDQITAAIKD